MTSSVDRLAARIRRLEEGLKRATTTPQLAYSTVEDGAIGVRVEGESTMELGLQYDGSSAVAVLTGPTPPQPMPPVVEPVIGGLKIRVTGDFLDGAVVPMDFARFEIHVSDDPNFFPDIYSTLYATVESARGGEHIMALPYIKHYVRVVARSLAGKPSPPSDRAEGTPRFVQQLDLDPGIPLGGGGGPTEAPASSPDTVVTPLGVGAVLAAWPSVDGAESYEVFVSHAPITAFDASTLLVETTANSLAIGHLPGTTPFTPDTPVYVRVRAKNSLGTAPAAGGEGSATPRRATGSDIAADYVYAGTVQAVQLSSGNLSAVLALLGSLTVGTSTGRRIILDPTNGLQLIDAAGTVLVSLPLATDGVNTFKGDGVFNGITALGRASFRGNDNEISRNSSFVLASGTTKPSNAPNLSNVAGIAVGDFPASITAPGAMTQVGDTLHIVYDSANAGTFGANVYKLATWNMTTGAGGAVGVATMPKFTGPNNTEGFPETYDLAAVKVSSVARIGSTYYATVYQSGSTYDVGGAYKNKGWFIYQWAAGSATVSARWRCPEPSFAFSGSSSGTASTIHAPVLATDGATLWLYMKKGLASVVNPLQRYNIDLATGAASGLVESDTTLVADEYQTGALVGAFDRGVTRHLVSTYDSSTVNVRLLTFTTGFAAVPAENASGMLAPHYASAEARWYGLIAPGFTGTAWRRAQLSKNVDTTKLWVAYSWYDSDPAGTGTHETTLSPIVSITPTRYGSITLGLPVAPADAGDPDSPDSARWYIYRGSTQPTEAQMRQATGLVVSGGNTISLDLTSNATAPPAANSFPDGNAGQITSAIGGFVVRGDGTGAWPALINPINTALGNKADASALTTKADLVSGKVPTSQLPSFVTSVAGRSGAVTLGESDIANLTSDLNGLGNRITALEAVRPYGYRYPTATWTASGVTTIPADTQVELTGLGWDNTTREFIIQKAGLYSITVQAATNTSLGSGYVTAHIYKGATSMAALRISAAAFATANISKTLRLAVNDRISGAAFWSGGSAVFRGGENETFVTIAYLG